MGRDPVHRTFLKLAVIRLEASGHPCYTLLSRYLRVRHSELGANGEVLVLWVCTGFSAAVFPNPLYPALGWHLSSAPAMNDADWSPAAQAQTQFCSTPQGPGGLPFW